MLVCKDHKVDLEIITSTVHMWQTNGLTVSLVGAPASLTKTIDFLVLVLTSFICHGNFQINPIVTHCATR